MKAPTPGWRGAALATVATTLFSFFLTAILTFRLAVSFTQSPFFPLASQTLLTVVETNVDSQADFVNYFRAGLALSNYFDGDASLLPGVLWIFNLWPPGMPIIYAAVDFFVGDDGPFLLVYLFVVVGVWMCAFLVWFSTAVLWQERLALLSVFLLLIFSPIGDWIFGWTVLYSEALSLALITISSGLLWSSLRRPSNHRILTMFASGATLGAAAYLRSIFEFVGIGMLLFSFVLLCVTLVNNRGKSLSLRSQNSIFWIFGYITVTLPWRVFLYFSYTNRERFLFFTGSDRVWVNNWLPTDRWSDAVFPERFGINGLCQSYPQKCNEIEQLELLTGDPYSGQNLTPTDFRDLAIQAVIADPLPYIANRMQYFFQTTSEAITGNNSAALGAVLVIMMLFTLALMGGRGPAGNRNPRQDMVLITLLASLLTLMPPFASSFEPRYIFPAVTLLLLSLSAATQRSASLASKLD